MSTANDHFEGVYGPYTITPEDKQEVQRYRLSLLLSGLALTAGLLQWWQLGGSWAWIWIIPMATGLGLALRWIHIYLRPLHRTLQLLWLIGCLGWVALLITAGPSQALTTVKTQPLWILAIGPLFAALSGIGFKEFFCFQRPEAIGLTLLLPVALLGQLIGLINPDLCLALLLTAGLLLTLLAIRKFGITAAADVGDKSVFAYLDGQQPAGTS
ncbi:MAG: hypothetical protein CL862_03050 [Cyanobium sp. NAT70]|nr:hypothetical protein [Cyanobium sp. NAT70]|tara:strand:+ start:1234 stop:1872 length:639 start_codon:yes stop_codon:yes gene_type:complete